MGLIPTIGNPHTQSPSTGLNYFIIIKYEGGCHLFPGQWEDSPSKQTSLADGILLQLSSSKLQLGYCSEMDFIGAIGNSQGS